MGQRPDHFHLLRPVLENVELAKNGVGHGLRIGRPDLGGRIPSTSRRAVS
jgi:hypothetical protein